MKYVLHNISRTLVLLWLIATAGIYAQVSTYPYNEDFESGANGWVTGSLLGSPTGSWALGNPSAKQVLGAARSGSNCWTTNLQGNATPGERSYLESPDFDFSNLLLPKLTVWLQHSLADTSCGVNIWYSTNNGNKWNLLGSEQDPDWYTVSQIQHAPGYLSVQHASGVAVPGFTDNDPFRPGFPRGPGWYRGRKILHTLGGEPNVKFRIYYSDYDTTGGATSFPQEGFNVDDISIEESYRLSLGLPDSITVCVGMPVLLQVDVAAAGTNAQLQWSTGSTGDSIVVNKTGWVHCSLTFGSSTQQDSVFIMHQAPLVRGGSIEEFGANRRSDSIFSCSNQQPYLYFIPNPNIQHHVWTLSNGQTSLDSRAYLTQKGLYYLQLTDYNSCLSEDSVRMIPVMPPLVGLPTEVKHCDSVDVNLLLGPSSSSIYYPVWHPDQSPIADTLAVLAKYRFGESGSFVFLAIDGLNYCNVYDTVEVYVGPMQNTVATGPDYGTNEGFAYIEDGLTWSGNAPLSFDWDNSGQYISDDSIGNLAQGTYKVKIRDVLGCRDSIEFTIDHAIAVFPGDTDRDGMVGMQDLFPIGMYYNNVGPLRPGASLAWSPQPAPRWNVNMPDGNDIRHVDVNGNGRINEADTLGIFQNYSFVHTNKKSTSGAPAISFQMPNAANVGDTLHIPIMIGDTNALVKNTYGLAFSIVYDTALVKENSVKLDFSGSWFGTKGRI